MQKPTVLPRRDTRNHVQKTANTTQQKEVIEITNVRILPKELLEAIAPLSETVKNLMSVYISGSLDVLSDIPGVSNELIKQGEQIKKILNRLGDSHARRSSIRQNVPVPRMRDNSSIASNTTRTSMDGFNAGRENDTRG